MSEVTDIILPVLNQIQGRLTRIEERLDKIEEGQRSLNTRMSLMERGLSEVHSRVDMIDVRLDRMEKFQHLTERSLMEHATPFEGPKA